MMLLQQPSSLHSLPSKGSFFSAGTWQFRLGCCAELGKGDHRGEQHVLNIWAPHQVSYLCVFASQAFFWALGAEGARGFMELLLQDRNVG